MNDARTRFHVDWGHLVFVLCIAGATAWYLADCMSVSTDIHNLLLVAPLCVLALVLCVAILPQCFTSPAEEPKEREGGIEMIGSGALRASDRKSLLPIGAVACALGVYVLTLDVIGFDVGTWLFTLVVMIICGERRVVPLVVYPLVVAIILISGFRALLPYPMYTLVL